MLFSRRAHPTLPDSDLSVQDHQLLCRVSQFKYLGLNFSEDLSWSHHIHIQCKKSHKLLGIQFRHFYAHCNSRTLYILFKLVILPHLEYGCVVWDPHLSKDISTIENVHKFALKVCSKQWRASYKSLCNIIHAPSMSERRTQLRLITLYNILHGNLSVPSHSMTSKHLPYATRLINKHQLVVPYCRTNSFKNSFFPFAISHWNNLSFDTKRVTSQAMFRNLLMQRPIASLLLLLLL